jgi:hypothetical protein
MSKTIRTAASALLASLLLAAVAWAGPLSGAGEVSSKNLQEHTITIKGRSYLVTEKTVLRNAQGRRVALRGLAVPDEHSDGSVAHATFEAVETRRGLELISLRLSRVPE